MAEDRMKFSHFTGTKKKILKCLGFWIILNSNIVSYSKKKKKKGHNVRCLFNHKIKKMLAVFIPQEISCWYQHAPLLLQNKSENLFKSKVSEVWVHTDCRTGTFSFLCWYCPRPMSPHSTYHNCIFTAQPPPFKWGLQNTFPNTQLICDFRNSFNELLSIFIGVEPKTRMLCKCKMNGYSLFIYNLSN